MRHLSGRSWFGGCFVSLVVALTSTGSWGSTLAEDGQKQVLVLYSARRDAQIVLIGEREFPRVLDRGLPDGLDYYSEYIDRARFPDPLYKAAFRDFLRLKYRDKRFDVVIAIQDPALEFVREHQGDLFADTPIVYFAGSAAIAPLANATGIVAGVDFTRTLALVAQLQPDVRQVFVVSGTETGDVEYERLAREQFRSFESRLTFTYLSGLTTTDLERRLAALPSHSIVYYVIVNRDGAGAYFHPLEYLDRLAAVANAPIYCWVDS